ncbi:XRE family transcriptional regulator [Gemmatimonas sp.]|uniref:XRE family transcriptional regulator n=1 Tax=Gemmatimonas sp. TaxID=1962908 RepID=UPI0025B7DF9A|nr:XRE family transcriptional regulator [Gemmatimonas sp.]MCA2991098.1 ImmA/IrrE family metallo-endopeptidase [Gemmatimonas sp.]
MSSAELEVLEAVPSEDQRIGTAIRERRESLRLSQGQLAEAAGLPAPQTVSAIEKGERAVRASEIVRIARALHIEAAALLAPEAASDAPRVLWRRGSKMRNRVREARLLERARRYAQLERWCNEHAEASLPSYDFDPATARIQDAQHLAERVRRDLELGPYPARTIRVRLEEDYGVKIFFEDLGEGEEADGSAACVRHSSFGAAILMGARDVTWRQIFSFAHELFHLVTWGAVEQAWRSSTTSPDAEPSWYRALEVRADEFASALLMPLESITSRFDARVKDGHVSLADLAQLAVEFGVSTQALAIRLHTVRRISRQSKEQLVKNDALRAMFRSLRPESQRALHQPLPPRMEQLARTAYLRREVGKSVLAKFLEKHIADLSDFHLSDADAAEATVTVS